MLYIMVDSVAAMSTPSCNGGELVQPVEGMPEITARFRDPGGT